MQVAIGVEERNYLVASGPGRAHSGSRAWATNFTGHYSDNATPLLADSDGDGVSDGAEIGNATNPLNAASF